MRWLFLHSVTLIPEKNLEDTVKAALQQIKEKQYDAELIGLGFDKEEIHHYGFALKGKEVLIGE